MDVFIVLPFHLGGVIDCTQQNVQTLNVQLVLPRVHARVAVTVFQMEFLALPDLMSTQIAPAR